MNIPEGYRAVEVGEILTEDDLYYTYGLTFDHKANPWRPLKLYPKFIGTTLPSGWATMIRPVKDIVTNLGNILKYEQA